MRIVKDPLIAVEGGKRAHMLAVLPFPGPAPLEHLRRYMYSAELKWFPLFLEVFAINALVVVLAFLLLGLLN
jgi:hypothetical protein